MRIFLLLSFCLLIIPTISHAAEDLMSLYEAQVAATSMDIPLDKPHRNAEQIAGWTEARVTNAMSIDPTNFSTKKKDMMADFEAYAITEYETYLNSAGLLNTLSTSKLKLNVIAAGSPKLVSEGALNGTYRWLFDVPLMLSYYPADLKSLKSTASSTKSNLPPNQKVTLRVQVGRLSKPDEKRPEGIVIERWSSVP